MKITHLAGKGFEKIVDSDVCFVEIKSSKYDEVVVLDGRRRIFLGVIKPDEIDIRKFRLLTRKIISIARANRVKRFAFLFNDFSLSGLKLSPAVLAEELAISFEMANYEFVSMKTEPEDGWPFVEEIILIGGPEKSILAGISRGKIIADEVNKTRTLSNTPGGEMTPSILVEKTKEAIVGTSVKLKVIDKDGLKKLGAGGILGVGQGSSDEPKLIVLEYRGGRKSDRPTVFVGKGVTFDTGGLNLKPSEHIFGMNMDMSGGAAVVHAIVLAAKLGLKKNIVGLVPAVENMPSGSSYRPGDILRTISGKTIEVLNTDAEGRIILADALCYAKEFNPRAVIDVATLTGAAMIALGDKCSAIFTRDEKLASLSVELGEASGDYVWRLPLWDEYDDGVRGTFGDVSNLHNKGSRYGGAIYAAAFLKEFTKDYKCPWLHIDIAPRMVASDGEYLASGAVGAPVRLLLKLAESL